MSTTQDAEDAAHNAIHNVSGGPELELLRSPASETDFESRVAKLMDLTSDPLAFRRMQVEMYLFLSDMDKGMRGFMQSGGPGGIIGRLMGGKKEEKELVRKDT